MSIAVGFVAAALIAVAFLARESTREVPTDAVDPVAEGTASPVPSAPEPAPPEPPPETPTGETLGKELKEPPGVAEAESRTFESNGVTIHYLIQGQGKPVILIHGLYGSANTNWRLPGIFEELAKENLVVALDLRGHGRSDKPEEDVYGLQMVEDVVRLLDHLRIDKATVVGYSLGGMIVVKLLATHPDRVRAAVVGGMGWFREGSALQAVWRMAKDRGPVPGALVRSIGTLAVTEEELRSIEVPVRVAVGGRDPVKRLYVDPLRRVRGDWPVVEIAGAGHLSCVADRRFREQIVKWAREFAGAEGR